MAWSDAARRAALEARRRKIRSFLDRKDPKSGVENRFRRENYIRGQLLEGRINAKLTGRKQYVGLTLTDYNEASDTGGYVQVGPRRRSMRGEVKRSTTNYYLPSNYPNRTTTENLGKARATSTRTMAKKLRALARSKKPHYHSPYS